MTVTAVVPHLHATRHSGLPPGILYFVNLLIATVKEYTWQHCNGRAIPIRSFSPDCSSTARDYTCDVWDFDLSVRKAVNNIRLLDGDVTECVNVNCSSLIIASSLQHFKGYLPLRRKISSTLFLLLLSKGRNVTKLSELAYGDEADIGFRCTQDILQPNAVVGVREKNLTMPGPVPTAGHRGLSLTYPTRLEPSKRLEVSFHLAKVARVSQARPDGRYQVRITEQSLCIQQIPVGPELGIVRARGYRRGDKATGVRALLRKDPRSVLKVVRGIRQAVTRVYLNSINLSRELSISFVEDQWKSWKDEIGTLEFCWWRKTESVASPRKSLLVSLREARFITPILAGLRDDIEEAEIVLLCRLKEDRKDDDVDSIKDTQVWPARF
ncbi:hypothetical protein EI94DRAFT_1701240 [Lactarius quietus]|nr:hypothetical protein EI94DRAFT_1701240 [Lactarius quietus]